MDMLMQVCGQIAWQAQEWNSWNSWDSWGGQGWKNSKHAAKSHEPKDANYKGALQHLLQQAAKKEGRDPMVVNEGVEGEDKPAYETVEIEQGNRKMFKAIVTFKGQSYEGPLTEGRKKAEHAAAKVAAKEAFPGESIPGQTLTTGEAGVSGKKGQKRKGGGGASTEDMPAKGRLIRGVQLILGRSTSKQDISFTVEGEKDGEYIGTVSIPCTGNTYQGHPSESKKAAETSAAEVAWENLKDRIEPLEEEQKAKKAKRNKEEVEALKERAEAKKALKAGNEPETPLV